MNLELEDGRILEIEDTGYCVSFTLLDSNGDIDDRLYMKTIRLLI